MSFRGSVKWELVVMGVLPIMESEAEKIRQQLEWSSLT